MERTDFARANAVLAFVDTQVGYFRLVDDPEAALQRALETARKAVELEPHFGPNFAALGEALEATGAGTGASRAWRRAERAAQAAVERGEPDAVEWLEEAREALRRLGR